ncbi:MAG: aminopeptidase P family protein [Bacteriovoracaceae bacterium]|nr:aminopeptidase P family protein [Bacteriovoracaceae bacterium]
MFIKKIRKTLSDHKADAALISSFSQVQYALEIYQTIPRGEARGNLIVTKDKIYLITDPLTKRLIKKNLPENISLLDGDGFKFMKNEMVFLSEIKTVVKKEKIEKLIIFNYHHKNLKLGKVEVEPVSSNPLISMADLSTTQEQYALKKAANIVDTVFEKILGELKENVTEIEIRTKIDELMYDHGAESNTFPTIVAFGNHTNQIHATSNKNALKKNDLVMVDFGAVLNGVGSDITRTFVFGKASKEQKTMWQAVFEAQKRCLGDIRPGKSGKSIDIVSREVIRKYGFQDYYFHTLGHQLGLLKGAFILSPWEKNRIKKGMLLTVEPGVYTQTGGVRIEDDILVTDKGVEVLTQAPKMMEL